MSSDQETARPPGQPPEEAAREVFDPEPDPEPLAQERSDAAAISEPDAEAPAETAREPEPRAAEEKGAAAAEPSVLDQPPPHAFLKGAVFGLVLLVPLTALAVFLLARLEIGDPNASYYSIVAFAAVFAGLPAIVSTGGIGRAAARALVRPGPRGGPAASVRIAVVQTSIATIGLVLLTVVPLGEVPTQVGHWIWITVIGASSGTLGGFGLGLWIRYGSRTRPGTADGVP